MCHGYKCYKMSQQTIGGKILVSFDEDDPSFPSFVTIWQIKPNRLAHNSTCLHGIAVSISGTYKQRLQFYMPMYDAQWHGSIVEPSGVIPRRISHYLIWVFPDHKPSKRECIFTVYRYLKRLFRAGIYSDRSEFPALPVHGQHGDFFVVKYWTDILNWHHDFRNVWNACDSLHANYRSIGHFLRASKNNLYSIWPPGGVPREVIVRCRLAGRHLSIEDQDRHMNALNQHANGTENVVAVEDLE
jgi:hypothetical protein